MPQLRPPVRRKPIQGVQFYRQKPLLSFMVDCYAPQAKLVVEVDGSQHFDPAQEAAHRRLGFGGEVRVAE